MRPTDAYGDVEKQELEIRMEKLARIGAKAYKAGVSSDSLDSLEEISLTSKMLIRDLEADSPTFKRYWAEQLAEHHEETQADDDPVKPKDAKGSTNSVMLTSSFVRSSSVTDTSLPSSGASGNCSTSRNGQRAFSFRSLLCWTGSKVP